MIIGSRPIRKILVLGFDAAGKTTILYQLNSNDIIHSHALGFSTEMTTFQNHIFFSWDVPQVPMKSFELIWRHFYDYTEGKEKQLICFVSYNFLGVIFVMDSTDMTENWKNANNALTKILSENSLKGVPLLILLNKADLMKSSLLTEAKIRFNMEEIGNGRKWKIMESCALDMIGVLEGIEWIFNIDHQDKMFKTFF